MKLTSAGGPRNYSYEFAEYVHSGGGSEKVAKEFLVELERLCEIRPETPSDRRDFVLINAPLWKRCWAQCKVLGLLPHEEDAEKVREFESSLAPR